MSRLKEIKFEISEACLHWFCNLHGSWQRVTCRAEVFYGIFKLSFLHFMHSLDLTGDRWIQMLWQNVCWPCVGNSKTHCVWSLDWLNWSLQCTSLVRKNMLVHVINIVHLSNWYVSVTPESGVCSPDQNGI